MKSFVLLCMLAATAAADDTASPAQGASPESGLPATLPVMRPVLEAARSAAPADKMFRFGARLGMSMAKIGGDQINDAVIKSKTGLSVSAFTTIKLHPNFAIEPGLGYTQRGYKVKGASETGSFDYVDIPITAVAIVPVHRMVRLRALAGPSVNFMTGAKIKANGTSADVSDNAKSPDIGILFGAGADLVLKQGLVLFDIRYERGLRTLDDSQAEGDIKNRGFLVNAGFAY